MQKKYNKKHQTYINDFSRDFNYRDFYGYVFVVYKKYPITYEDCVIHVVDKRETKSFAYTGNAVVSSKRYYLLFDDGKELRVSSAMYDDTNIDDYIIITYSYQKDRVIGTKIKFNK